MAAAPSTSQNATPAPPASLVCPLTQVLFVDPVVDHEGNSFEREAIEKWLDRNPSSPITRSPLEKSMLAPNRALRTLVEEWCAANNVPLVGTTQTAPTANSTDVAAATATPLQSQSPTRTPSAHKNTNLSLSLSARPLRSSDLPANDPNPLSADHDEYLVLVSVTPPVHPNSQDGLTYVEPPQPARPATTPAAGTTTPPITPPQLPTTSTDLIAVVDVSGSMGIEATFQDENGKAESAGLTVLDVVKHAVRTLVHTLGPNDRLGVVAFSDDAEIILPLTFMDTPGKTTADTKLAPLSELASTNLWSGLDTALTLFRSSARRPNCTRSIFLLTDGQPNVEPPRGTLGMIQRLKDQENGLPVDQVTTFGFGYSLDSALLHSIAVQCGTPGMYGFIPDSGMVGTAFVNSVSAVVSKVPLRSLKVKLDLLDASGAMVHPKETEAVAVGAQVPMLVTSWGAELNVGTVGYGQSRDVVVRVKVPKGASGDLKVNATLSYESLAGDGERGSAPPPSTTSAASLSLRAAPSEADFAAVTHHLLRQTFSRTLISCVDKATAQNATETEFRAAQSLLKDFVDVANRLAREVERSPSVGVSAPGGFVRDVKASTKGLMEDVKGQATLALSKYLYFTRWGQHYLKSLARAHLVQECSNFKDPGLQLYNSGGHPTSLFSRFRDTADDAFGKLKVVPSRQATAGGRGGRRRGGGAPQVQMARLNNRYGGCFLPSTPVLLANQSYKSVGELCKGDLVMSIYAPGDGTHGLGTARVRAVVVHQGQFEMVEVTSSGKGVLVEGDMRGDPGRSVHITKWHPVLSAVNGSGSPRWMFPAELASTVSCTADTVCSVLLEPEFESLNLAEGKVRAPRETLAIARPHTVILSRSNVPAITLAHGLRDAGRRVASKDGGWVGWTHVVEHELFGTDAVVEQMESRI
ncbi:hypothetical protein HDU93_008260 [Gonapodya sp. JEL0774]|nr:hypothetical protein HDU93_008260 [Gonapodya sp. JEL0774]